MKRIGIRICLCIAAMLLLCGFSRSLTKVAEVVDYKITINGADLELYQDVVIINDRTYIPLRAAAEYFGGTVSWNGDEEEITINFSDGLIPFRQNDRWGFMDVNCKVAVEPKYIGAEPFSEGLALVWKSGSMYKQYGYIDETGKEVIPCIYSVAGDFKNGYALVSEDGKWQTDVDRWRYYIDKNGNDAFGKKYKFALGFSEGYAAVMVSGEINPLYEPLEQKWSFIDTSGEIVSPEVYEEAYSFQNGYAVVKADGVWKIINHSFEYISGLEFENVDAAFQYMDEL